LSKLITLSFLLSTFEGTALRSFGMQELMRTNDITLTALVRALLDEAGIPMFELDVNMSVLEGSIGILPRRVMVAERDYDRVMRILSDNEVELPHQ
jgi:DNA-binding MltR family transcriptional regulator